MGFVMTSHINIAQCMTFFGIDKQTLTLVQTHASTIVGLINPAVDSLYEIIRKTPETCRYFSTADSIKRAKHSQVAHWKRLFTNSFDGDYIESVKSIAIAHLSIGLESTWYMGSYCHVCCNLQKNLLEFEFSDTATSREEVFELIAAVNKLVFFDLDIAMATFAKHSLDLRNIEIEELTTDFDKQIAVAMGSYCADLGRWNIGNTFSDQRMESPPNSTQHIISGANQIKCHLTADLKITAINIQNATHQILKKVTNKSHTFDGGFPSDVDNGGLLKNQIIQGNNIAKYIRIIEEGISLLINQIDQVTTNNEIVLKIVHGLALNAIYELRKIKNQAEERSIEFETLFENACIGIFIITPDRLIKKANRYCEESIFGYKRGGMVGQISRIFYPSDEAFASFGANAYPTLAAGERYVTREAIFCRKDGSPFPAQAVGSLVDPTDPSRGTIWFVSDISELKERTSALHRQAEELANKNKLLSIQSDIKSNFLSMMSHEIRTPLNAIIGMSRLALNTGLSQHQADYVHKIYHSGERLLGIINDVLDISKIEADKLTIESTEFSINDLFDNLSDLFAAQAAEKGIELIFDLDANVPQKLIGDQLRISQILVNYTNNALKFTDSGYVCVVTKIDKTLLDAFEIRFEVHDTGPGMEDGQIEKLFQSFQQADSSITRKFGGTGLGLAISKRLAELMGGSVGVSSSKGVGSVFWVKLPLLGTTEHTDNTDVQPLKNKRVVYIDNSDKCCEVTAAMLSKLGCLVEVFSSVETAREKLLKRISVHDDIDVIIIDSSVDQLRGIDIVASIQAHCANDLPLIIKCTTLNRENDSPSTNSVSRINSVLFKPFLSWRLDAELQKLLGFAAHENIEINHCDLALQGYESCIIGSRILLVEDNKFNQQVAAELLRGHGMHVDIAENGALAVQMVTDTPYDLVLMDMQMPIMDGISATEEIRRLGYLSLPIVAMTANAMNIDRERCLAAGMNDFITKPINPISVGHALIKWIANDSLSVLEDNFLGNSNALCPQTQLPSKAAWASDLDASILDISILGQVYDWNLNSLCSVFKQFTSRARMLSDKISNAFGANDFTLIGEYSHNLKGMALSAGATKIADLASSLERSANINDAISVSCMIIQLEQVFCEFDLIVNALSKSGEVSK